jgi:Flp pilus assembly protein TadG
MNSRRYRRNRKGTVLVLTAFLMIVMMAILAFAVDLGYMQLVDVQMQRTADAAALAAAWDLIDENRLISPSDPIDLAQNARDTAATYAGLNRVCTTGPSLAVDDVLAGHVANPFVADAQMTLDTPSLNNAVWVRVRRTEDQNGAIPLFFARALGFHSTTGQAEATAVFINSIAGFQAPSDPEQRCQILPFTLDEATWDLWPTVFDDDWGWNEETEQVYSGSDGIPEINLYPQGTGSSGNRGTVDIGGYDNSTTDICRQILEGISSQDFQEHGAALVINYEAADGAGLQLNGDTGISAAVKEELHLKVGEKRIIPIFSDVVNPGENATYRITQWLGIRIMEVKLTGPYHKKRLMIQPANVCQVGALPAPPGVPASNYVYSPVWLMK